MNSSCRLCSGGDSDHRVPAGDRRDGAPVHRQVVTGGELARGALFFFYREEASRLAVSY